MANNDDAAPWEGEDDELDGALESGERMAEESKARRLAKFEATVSRSATIRAENKNLVKRARALASEGFVEFKDTKTKQSGGMMISEVQNTDSNKFVVLDALFGNDPDIPRPHFDEFRGRIVDQTGLIIDDHYPVVEWVDIFRVAGLKGITAKDARATLREWAMTEKSNDLIERVVKKVPEWDGKLRMERYLIDLFEPFDTPLNRDISKYLWLSLYTRIMMPGEQAPIVVSLFGVQNCGKSYFGKRISQLVTGLEDADSVQLDLGSDRMNFLREITGFSVVASVGEMTGFNRGDLNKIKDFISRSVDKLHHKFEGHINQPRQWITMMDGNIYEGLQRDASGNRRFYPLFCGQMPDKLGQPQWRDDLDKGPFIASEQFEEDFWQLMAEADAWLDHHGRGGYSDFVKSVSKQVFEFSQNEMNNDRGTIADDTFDIYLIAMLKTCPKFIWHANGNTRNPPVVCIKTAEFKRHFLDNVPHSKPNWRHMKNKLLSLGANEFAFTGAYHGYQFKAFGTIEDFVEKIGFREYDDGGSVVSAQSGHEQF